MIFGPFKMILRIISFVLSLLLLYFAFGFVQIWYAGREHSHQPSDAIMVMGTRQDNCVPSPTLAGRLDEAVRLYNLHLAPWVVVTGYKQPGDVCTEAQASARYLVQHGIPGRVILQAGGSDTWQNVSSALPVLSAHQIHSVLIVSDTFHVYRATQIAKNQGLEAAASATTTSFVKGSNLTTYYFGETFRVAVGRIVGYQRLSQWTSTVKDVVPVEK